MVSVIASLLFLLLLGVLNVRAAPQTSPSALTEAEINKYTPYTYFARATYCGVSTKKWNCGESCTKNPTFKLTAAGGDGNLTQYWYVGYDPTLKTVIVAHQGTDRSKSGAVATIMDIAQVHPSKSLFPGVTANMLVHKGFAESHSRSASAVLAAVQKTLKEPGTTKHVTLVGHSLGAALSLLDGIYLPLHLPGITFSVIGYGMPRVGNKAFADYVDAHVKSLVRINNGEDPVPIMPDASSGYRHPSGEIHISNKDRKWYKCAGQENPSAECSDGSGASIFSAFTGGLDDHSGPYGSVSFGSC
ncbi:hypothetical protein PC9H_006773 [Pleurotus ostreatus]|uniref:Fungal lipase-type domain-containing protein n=1 Tax=Pleurotus ostreatus TaxID=5322 RepID=A0A8H7DRT6_PLEOS|nr:uncharacterized protein PC9H_006773 [Pleurotus ostreatus]KAF7431055.1 hypothetical protein PC9H_006773 [Pleurotus ostreatus]KAJ8695446.1 hypothetical protein PTI98_008051 [Pleurotus ostreatus]